MRAYSRKWYAALTEEQRARYRARHRKHRGRGMPESTRAEPAVCELCNRPPGKISLHLDHCHKTGAFRGWLCNNCNRGIGYLKDDPVLLRKAARYLAK